MNAAALNASAFCLRFFIYRNKNTAKPMTPMTARIPPAIPPINEPELDPPDADAVPVGLAEAEAGVVAGFWAEVVSGRGATTVGTVLMVLKVAGCATVVAGRTTVDAVAGSAVEAMVAGPVLTMGGVVSATVATGLTAVDAGGTF